MALVSPRAAVHAIGGAGTLIEPGLHGLQPAMHLDLRPIPALHDRANAHWHNSSAPAPSPASPFEELVLQQHRANFDLWHQEDAARDPDAKDATIARVKHSIDVLNQQRNDLVEALDLALLADAGTQDTASPLHSETPGLIIDRLSILSLKLFHTEEQTRRADADEAHRARNRDRLHTLQLQRGDLAACLVSLWAEIHAGHRHFKLYRQLKMYNDPTLNPVLYRSGKASTELRTASGLQPSPD